MKKFLFLLITIMSLSTFAQKTTPIYGDTVSVIMNLKIGKSIVVKDTALRHSNKVLSIDSASGKLKLTDVITSIPSIKTFYSEDDSIRTTRKVSGADTNDLYFENFNTIYGLGRNVFMGTLKYHFFAYSTATGQESYDTISGTPVRLIIATDQTSHLVQLGTFYDGITKYSLQQSTKDRLWSKVTNGVDSTSIVLYPEKIQILDVDDSIPNKLYGKNVNGNLIEYNYLNKIINVPATTDTIFLQGMITEIIAPPATIATLYLSLPPNPTDGTFVTVKFSEQVTSAHWISSDGSTVKGINTPGLIESGIEVKMYYDLATTTWY